MKRIKRFTSLLIVLCMVMSLVPNVMISVSADTAAPTFSGGDGTEQNPYLIKSAQDMIDLSNAVAGREDYGGKYFKAESDSEIVLTTEGGFNPIGNYSCPFRGNFDGNNVTFNLTLTGSNYLGVFGLASKPLGSDTPAVIKNVITKGTVTGTGTDTDSCIAGVVGSVCGAKIIDCRNEAAITGDYGVGGIVGDISEYAGKVYNCVNTGSITATAQVGGIVGRVNHDYAHAIANCVNGGSVTTISGGSANSAGGIVGLISTSSAKVENCINSGTVSSTSDGNNYIGTIAGEVCSLNSVRTNYYIAAEGVVGVGACRNGYEEKLSKNYEKSAMPLAPNSIQNTLLFGLLNGYVMHNIETIPELKYFYANSSGFTYTDTVPDGFYKITYRNDDIDDIAFVQKSGYKGSTITIKPRSFAKINSAGIDGILTSKEADGSFTFTMPEYDVTVSVSGGINLDEADGAYQIKSVDDMKILSDAVNNGYDTTGKTFALANDITINDSDNYVPVGGGCEAFKGTFDGANHTVTMNLTVDGNNVGLFARTDGATIKNLKVDGSIAGAEENVGGIVGTMTGGKIESCTALSTMTVSGKKKVGGIVGLADGADVLSCVNNAAVTMTNSGENVGGIVGYTQNSANVLNCENNGTVTGDNAGGIVGYTKSVKNKNDVTNIINCINKGTIALGDRSNYGGGIAGYVYGEYNSNDAYTYALIKNCVNNGEFSGTSDNKGGIVGTIRFAVTRNGIENCLYNSDKNSGINDIGECEPNHNGYEATQKFAVAGAEITSESVIGKLNWFADRNKSNFGEENLKYWEVSEGALKLTSTEPEAIPNMISVTDEFAKEYMTLSSETAVQGTEITVSFKVPDYLSVHGIEVKKNDQTVVEDTKSQSEYQDADNNYISEYKFTMPDGDVAVDVDITAKVPNINGTYSIVEKTDLLKLSKAVSAGYDTTGDVYKVSDGISDTDLTTLEGFAPIGTLKNPFKGTFDGNNKTFKLSFTDGEALFVGLFGNIEDAIVKNVGVNGTIKGKQYVGGITGKAVTSTIANCHNNAAVTGDTQVGGIVGDLYSTCVYSCSNTGALEANNVVGGIAGGLGHTTLDTRSKVINCYNSGNIKWSSGENECAGGIVGDDSNGITVNCANTGDITDGTNPVGGAIIGNSYNPHTIAGNYYSAKDGVVGIGRLDRTVQTTDDNAKTQSSTELNKAIGLAPLNAYVTGNKSDNEYLRYWVADSNSVITFTDEVQSQPYDISVSDDELVDAPVYQFAGKTTTIELKTDSLKDYEKISFKAMSNNTELTFTPVEGKENQYIFTMPEGDVEISAEIELKFAKSAGGVYTLSGASDMILFSKAVNDGAVSPDSEFAVAESADVIDLTTGGFEPIGTSEHKFEGVFNGGKNTFKLAISKEDDYVGLFGYVSDSVIKNTSVTGSVSGDEYVGAVIGLADDTEIMNCSSSAQVSGNDYVGGIAGEICNGSTLRNCYNSGSVKVTVSNNEIYVGGIVGNSSGSVYNCANSGAVSDKNSGKAGGGIAGNTGSYSIYECYYVKGTADCGVEYINKDKAENETSAGEITAVEKNDFFTLIGLSPLNKYAEREGMRYWQVTGEGDAKVISFTDTKPDIYYSLSSNYEKLISFEKDVKKGDTVVVTPVQLPEYAEFMGIKVNNGSIIPPDETGKCSFTMSDIDSNIYPCFKIALPLWENTSDCYAISDAEALNKFAKAVNSEQMCGYFKNAVAHLTADISVSTEGGFEPIGTAVNAYGGYFFGDGHTLTLDISASDTASATGLFAYTNSANIRNLVLKGTVYGGENKEAFTGALIGDNVGSIVENVYSEVDVSGYGFVGGFAGKSGPKTRGDAGLGNYRNIMANGTVKQLDTSSDGKAAGTVQSIGKSNYYNIFVNSDKNKGMYSVGYVENPYGTLRDPSKYVYIGVYMEQGWTKAKSDVLDDSDYYFAMSESELFTSETENMLNKYTLNVVNCYFWDFVTKDGKNTVEMSKDMPSDMHSINVDVYYESNIKDMPKFANTGETIDVCFYDAPDTAMILGIKVTDSDGNEIESQKAGKNKYTFVMPDSDVQVSVLQDYGLAIGPNGEYCIASAKDLVTFGEIANMNPYANAKVTAKSIAVYDLIGQLLEDGMPEEYVAEAIYYYCRTYIIGRGSAKPYKGVFDGNGATIEWGGALFDYTDGAQIKNLNLKHPIFEEYGAGLVHEAKDTKIDNCSVYCDETYSLYGNSNQAVTFGGIVGYADDCVITNCTVDIRGLQCDEFGGIAYRVENGGIIANCTVLASTQVAAESCYGGIVLENAVGSELKIYNCVHNSTYYGYDDTVYPAGTVYYAEKEDLTLKNNFFVTNDEYMTDLGGMQKSIMDFADPNSIVTPYTAATRYIPVKLNKFIDENPDIVEGVELKKWGCNYVRESGSTEYAVEACIAKEKEEIYAIEQDGIKTYFYGEFEPMHISDDDFSIAGAIVGEEVYCAGPYGAEITVTTADGKNIKCKNDSFEMPASNVTVTVTMDSGIEETKEIDGKTYAVVKTAEDLVKAMQSINSGNTALNLYINNDIDITGEVAENYPELNLAYEYNGIIEGNGKTLNFKDGMGHPMLGAIGKKSVIRNLTVDGTFESEDSIAAFAIANAGAVINCINKADVTATGVGAGFVCTDMGVIINCINKGDITGASAAAVAGESIQDGSQSAIFASTMPLEMYLYNEGTLTAAEDGGTYIAQHAMYAGDLTIKDENGKLPDKKAAVATANGMMLELKALSSDEYRDLIISAITAMIPLSESNLETIGYLLDVLGEVKEWTVVGEETAEEVVFADEKNAPYYNFVFDTKKTPYKSGTEVETVIDVTSDEGYEVSSISVAMYNDEEIALTEVAGKANTYKFTMPYSECYVVSDIVAAGLTQDDDGYYLVETLDDLIKVKNTIQKGNERINVKLMADIDGYTEGSIGSYKGIFDGNNHSITVDMSGEGVYGLFYNLLEGSVVKNLTIKGNISSSDCTYVGSVAGYSYGSVINCTNSATVTAAGEGNYVGGIVGRLGLSGTGANFIEGCKNEGSLSGRCVGGIVGMVDGSGDIALLQGGEPLTVKDCENTADLSQSTSNSGGYLGGIVGYADGLKLSGGNNIKIVDCENKGDIDADSCYVGGIAAYTAFTDIEDCKNGAKVNNDCTTGTNGYPCSGGIAGRIVSSTITDCTNEESVSALNTVGGIAGIIIGSTILDCMNSGSVDMPQDGGVDVGGIAGMALGKVSLINNCINSGKVSGMCPVGIASISENSDSYLNIVNCYNSGELDGSGSEYAIAFAYNNNAANLTVKNSYWVGSAAPVNLECADKCKDVCQIDSDTAAGFANAAAKLNSNVSDDMKKWTAKDKELMFAGKDDLCYYEIIIEKGIKGGSVKADKAYAKPGETVNLTIVSNDSASVPVIKGVELDENNSFVMPDNTVRISASFGDGFRATEKSDTIKLYENVAAEDIVLSEYVEFVNDDIERDFAFALAEDSVLPEGMSLSYGRIVGTPTKAGTYTVVIDVTDPNSVSLMSLDSATAMDNAKMTLTIEVVKTYKVTVGATEHGSVTADKAYAAPNERVNLVVKPDNGYAFGSASGVELDANGSFVMPESDVEVKVVFAPTLESTGKESEIELVENFEMTAVNLADYVKFSDETVTKTVEFALSEGSALPEGMKLENGVVSGTPKVSGKHTVKFDVVTSEANLMSLTSEFATNKTTLTLTFDIEATYKVGINTVENGKVKADKEYAKAGEEVKLTIEPNEGYMLVGVTGVTVDTSNVFVMPARDVSVGAVFTSGDAPITGPAIFATAKENGDHLVKYVVPTGTKYTLICAEYGADGVQSITVATSENDTNNGEITIAAGKTAKIMLWDSLNGMKPLCEACEIK